MKRARRLAWSLWAICVGLTVGRVLVDADSGTWRLRRVALETAVPAPVFLRLQEPVR